MLLMPEIVPWNQEAMMKAMFLERLGPDEPFVAAERPERRLGANEVRIAVHAAGVNPVDMKIRAGGAIAPFPHILGCDVAGTVTEAGEAVGRFAVGDKVYGCAGGVKGHDGSYGQEMIADSRLLAKKPAGLSFREAAALPLVSITAWEALVDRAQVKPGEWVLVHGGTGGVGHIGVQLARTLGAVVHTTISSPAKAEIAHSLGAHRTIDYRASDAATYVKQATGGRGYDVVFDTIGGANIAASLEAVAVNGRVATIVSSGAAPDLTPLHLKNASLHVIFMLIPMLTGRDYDRHGAILERVARLVDIGALKPLLDPARFALEQAGEAHDHLQSGRAVGKIVLDVRDADAA